MDIGDLYFGNVCVLGKHVAIVPCDVLGSSCLAFCGFHVNDIGPVVSNLSSSTILV